MTSLPRGVAIYMSVGRVVFLMWASCLLCVWRLVWGELYVIQLIYGSVTDSSHNTMAVLIV